MGHSKDSVQFINLHLIIMFKVLQKIVKFLLNQKMTFLILNTFLLLNNLVHSNSFHGGKPDLSYLLADLGF